MGGQRFTQEVDILARLEHPNILPLPDAGTAGPVRFYVTPYADGDLQTRINEEKQFPLDEALEITRQVAAALDYAHSHNVLHRDIKPANILFDGEKVLVCHFGIARAIERAGRDSLSSSGLIVGTPQYMSPEQARHDKKIDGRTDIYSLASVLYEMLVGQPPFTGPTVQAVIARITKERPPKIRVVRPDVPESVESLIEKALSKALRNRPALAIGRVESTGELTHRATVHRSNRRGVRATVPALRRPASLRVPFELLVSCQRPIITPSTAAGSSKRVLSGILMIPPTYEPGIGLMREREQTIR